MAPLVAAAEGPKSLFGHITEIGALNTLRCILAELGVANAHEYRTHDLRRGHALDLQLSGAPLHEILEAGDWKSPAFLVYLDRDRLERDMVMQAHFEDSDNESDVA